MEIRIAKIVMVGSLGIFALLVTLNNLTDYNTNYQFVSHVLSMDTSFPGNRLFYRRVMSPDSWRAAYALIILGEGLTGLLLAMATVALLRHVRADATDFNRAKRLVYVGAALGFLMWFFGFMVVGGEWFQMWQSQTWNGQQAAFRVYITILVVLILVNQYDADLPPRPGS